MAIYVDQAIEQLHRLLQLADDAGLRRFLSEIQPADLAELVVLLSETRRRQVFEALDLETAARTLEIMDYEAQYAVITSLPRPLARSILSRMSSDDLADMLGALTHTQSEEILSLIPDSAQAIRTLMQYPEDSAGGIMSLGFVAIKSHHTVEQAIAYLRRIASEVETVYYVYVRDDQGRLTGVVSLRELVLAPSHVLVKDIAITNVISAHVLMNQVEVAHLFEKYDFLALPVVDDDNHLLGIVTVDDVIDVIQEETSRDIARMGGQQPLDEPYLGARVLSLVRNRIGWLLLLFLAQSVTGNILAAFEDALQAVIALTFFIPLLIGTGGNAGAQASTLVVRAMAIGEVTWKHFARVVSREALTGVILGSVMAVVGFGWAAFLAGDPAIGLTVGLTIALVVTAVSIVGASLPILAQRLNLDPAVASAPLVTVVADATGLVLYFLIAQWILGL